MWKWIAVLGAAALSVGAAWFLLSLIMLLRDYDDIDWGDDEF